MIPKRSARAALTFSQMLGLNNLEKPLKIQMVLWSVPHFSMDCVENCQNPRTNGWAPDQTNSCLSFGTAFQVQVQVKTSSKTPQRCRQRGQGTCLKYMLLPLVASHFSFCKTRLCLRHHAEKRRLRYKLNQ